MQAEAAELSGYAGKFRCFSEIRVKIHFFRFIYFCGLAIAEKYL
jgi:hypothetical protein